MTSLAYIACFFSWTCWYLQRFNWVGNNFFVLCMFYTPFSIPMTRRKPTKFHFLDNQFKSVVEFELWWWTNEVIRFRLLKKKILFKVEVVPHLDLMLREYHHWLTSPKLLKVHYTLYLPVCKSKTIPFPPIERETQSLQFIIIKEWRFGKDIKYTRDTEVDSVAAMQCVSYLACIYFHRWIFWQRAFMSWLVGLNSYDYDDWVVSGNSIYTYSIYIYKKNYYYCSDDGREWAAGIGVSGFTRWWSNEWSNEQCKY